MPLMHNAPIKIILSYSTLRQTSYGPTILSFSRELKEALGLLSTSFPFPCPKKEKPLAQFHAEYAREEAVSNNTAELLVLFGGMILIDELTWRAELLNS